MSTTTIAIESYRSSDDRAARPSASSLGPFARMGIFFKQLTSLGKSIVAVVSALAGGAVSVAGLFQIDPGVAMALSERFHGSETEWSENANVQILTSERVLRLTVKACNMGPDPRKTTHLAYVQVEGGGGFSNIEPFVMLRDKCSQPNTLWMHKADYNQMMQGVDPKSVTSSATFTRIDLDTLDELLGKAKQLDKGEA